METNSESARWNLTIIWIPSVILYMELFLEENTEYNILTNLPEWADYRSRVPLLLPLDSHADGSVAGLSFHISQGETLKEAQKNIPTFSQPPTRSYRQWEILIETNIFGRGTVDLEYTSTNSLENELELKRLAFSVWKLRNHRELPFVIGASTSIVLVSPPWKKRYVPGYTERVPRNPCCIRTHSLPSSHIVCTDQYAQM